MERLRALLAKLGEDGLLEGLAESPKEEMGARFKTTEAPELEGELDDEVSDLEGDEEYDAETSAKLDRLEKIIQGLASKKM